MAILKHDVAQNQTLDLDALVKYIELLNEQPDLLPAGDLIKNCVDIVSTLVREDPRNVTWVIVQDIEEYLLRVVNCVDPDVRHELITAIVAKLNQFTSDPQCAVSPVTSIVLVVLSTDIETSRAAARWLVQQGELAGGMRASLACLYSWMFQWDGTPSLGDWVMSVIKALEEKERFDVLIETSLENLGNLISTMSYPETVRQSNADVIFHVLASLRESKEALDAVAPHVERVLTELASDSGQFSRQLLQNIVDILSCMINNVNKDTYAEVVLCLQEHMASRGCEYLQLIPWRARAATNKPASVKPLVKKVGLANLGNTCYMNSVMQALLLTRQFSTHVMLRMINMPYWAKMSVLFAKMMHSICTRLNPDDFFKVVKPPFFTTNNQHDSSEFLGYLFQLLQSFENRSDRNFDYSKPPVLTTATRWPRPIQSSSTAIEIEYCEPSGSSKPCSSGSVPSSSSLKRVKECESHLPKKRMRVMESAYIGRRSSFIDFIFGGVLLTRVECSECHSTSISRDVFRDLQLAFPDKPEGWQHSVQSLLEFYCTKEMLTGDNQYHCRDCGCLRDAERSVLIESTPKYLILVLKNFKFDPKLQVQTKLMHKVFHNQTVTVPTVRTRISSTYSLYAAVIHTGTTLDSGHYYTLAKDADTWYNYNDEEVEIANEQEINKLSRCCTPYVLFYKRTDIEEGAAPALKDLPPKLQESVMSHNKPYVGAQVNGAHISRP